MIVPENRVWGESRGGIATLEIASYARYDVSRIPVQKMAAGSTTIREFKVAGKRTFRVNIYEHAAPLYVYQVFGKVATPEQLHQELLDRIEQRYRRHRSMAEVIDLRFASVPDALVREHLTAWVTLNTRLIHERVVASIVVLRRPLLRWFLQAIWRVVPPPAQHYAVAGTPDRAIENALDRLAEAGAAPPAAAIHLLHDALRDPPIDSGAQPAGS